MNSKQIWATTATILVLSTFGPRSPGVWAQDAMAACRRGWEWVRHMLAHLFASKKNRLPVALPALTRGSYSFAEPELAWARSVYD